MRKTTRALALLLALLLFVAPMSAAATVPAEPGQWELTDIYPTPEDFNRDLTRLGELTKELSAMGGKLTNADALFDYFGLFEEAVRVSAKLEGYATLAHSANQADSGALVMSRQAEAASGKMTASLNALETELYAQPESLYDACREQERFAPYTAYLDRYAAGRSPDRPSDEVQSTIDTLSFLTGLPQSIFEIVNSVDFNQIPFINEYGLYVLDPSVLEDGERTQAGIRAYYVTLQNHGNTLAATLNAEMQKIVTQAELWELEPVEYAVSMMGMNEASTNALLNAAEKGLPDRRRLSDARAAYGVTSFAQTTPGRFPYDEGVTLILEALAPLGEDYIALAEQMLYGGHIDAKPFEDKHSGAFCSNLTPEIDPYILMTYNDDFGSVSTLAHELGHAVGALFCAENQPYATYEVQIAVSEIFSILNQILLIRHMMEKTEDTPEYALYLEEYATLIDGSFFRQTMYHEFQETALRMVEKGEYLTLDGLNELWGELNEKYVGTPYHPNNLTNVDWARIAHFYYGFYVFNYSTCIAAAINFADQVLDGQTEMYLSLLKTGVEDFAYNLIAAHGVDLAEAEAYQPLLDVYRTVVDELIAMAGSPLDKLEETVSAVVTRREVAYQLSVTLGLHPNAAAAVSDMSPYDPYYPWVSALVENGIMNGVGDGKFDPRGSLTWEQALSITARAARWGGLDAEMTDAEVSELVATSGAMGPVSAWARKDVALAARLGLIAVNGFDPKTAITADEWSSVLFSIVLAVG